MSPPNYCQKLAAGRSPHSGLKPLFPPRFMLATCATCRAGEYQGRIHGSNGSSSRTPITGNLDDAEKPGHLPAAGPRTTSRTRDYSLYTKNAMSSA